MLLATNPPPFTPSEPVTEVLHGVSVTDPYRWLEDQNSAPTRNWLEQQTTYTRAYLDAIPGRERIRKRISEFIDVDSISQPYKVSDRYFFLKRRAHEEQPTIMMRLGRQSEDIPLVDPGERNEGPTASVSIVAISHDGQMLAYGVRNSGEDALAVEFLDVGERRVLPDRLPRGLLRGLTFASDRKGFYYSLEPLGTTQGFRRAARWHAFGTPFEEDVEMFSAGDAPNLCLVLLGSSDSQHLLYCVLSMQETLTNDIYVQELTAPNCPRKILDRLTGTFSPRLVGNQVIALTDFGAPNFRVVAINLDRPQPENWREIVPESDIRIDDFRIAKEMIFISCVKDVSRCIDIFDISGSKRGTIAPPSKGTAHLFLCDPRSETVFYKSTSFADPPTIYTYDTRTGLQEIWAHNEKPIDPTSIGFQQVWYPSKDGTQIPLFLVSKKGPLQNGSRPTFLTGYGGFGSSITPQFTAYGTYLMECGFLFAVANLRGGAEFGEKWHEAGKRHNRQNAIDDFIAAAEWLLSEGYTTPGQLAIGGGSNAGLLVAAAATQRPDLFRAVICLGALLDMLRYDQFDCANLWVGEYGSAQNAGDFPFLQAYSPYHRVHDGTAYPAFLLVSGDSDTRCNPMHARKMAARLQAANSSARPILLAYRSRWGHMPVQPLGTRIEALTDRLAFLCNELGVKP